MSAGQKLIPPQPIQNPLQKICVLGISSGLGLGYVPVAPGTAGSLLGLVLGLGLLQIDAWLAWLACAALLALFSWAGARAGKHWGDMDSGHIVSDEVLGQALTLLIARSVLEQMPQMLFIALAFGLFRVFDVIKPQPARLFDRMSGGFYTQMDDVVAAAYAGLVLWAGAKIYLTLGAL